VIATLLLTALAAVATQSAQKLRYLGLAEATLRDPITHGELRAAILSPEGVESIRALFERSIAESLAAEGTLVTPELGGEATLDEGKLTLVPYPDPVHPILREMVALRREQPPVEPALTGQLRVASALDDPPARHHDDLVERLHTDQAMGDHQHAAARRRALQCRQEAPPALRRSRTRTTPGAARLPAAPAEVGM